jgi:hypothetical protein
MKEWLTMKKETNTAREQRIARMRATIAARRNAKKKTAAAGKHEPLDAKKRRVTAGEQRRKGAQKVNVLAAKFSKRLTDVVDKALVEAETLVKQNVPARFVSASLTNLRKQLMTSGIHARFDRRVTRAALRASANDECTKAQCDEAIGEIAKAVVAEVEEVLDQCDKAITAAVEKNFRMPKLAGRQVRREVQRTMFRQGLEFKF